MANIFLNIAKGSFACEEYQKTGHKKAPLRS